MMCILHFEHLWSVFFCKDEGICSIINREVISLGDSWKGPGNPLPYEGIMEFMDVIIHGKKAFFCWGVVALAS